MDIGGILKTRRERKGQTLEDVAFRAGTDAGNLSRIERNRQDVSVQRLARLCVALEMSLTELFEELEGKAKTPHLRDPASAFDSDTRQLIDLSDQLNKSGRRLLIGLARQLADTKSLS